MRRKPCIARAVKVKGTLLDHESTTAEWAEANSSILVYFALHHDTQARAGSLLHIRELSRHSSFTRPTLPISGAFCVLPAFDELQILKRIQQTNNTCLN